MSFVFQYFNTALITQHTTSIVQLYNIHIYMATPFHNIPSFCPLFLSKVPGSKKTCVCGHVFTQSKTIGGKRYSGKQYTGSKFGSHIEKPVQNSALYVRPSASTKVNTSTEFALLAKLKQHCTDVTVLTIQ